MKKILPLILIVVLIGISGAAFYFYKKTNTLTSPDAIAQQQSEEILSRVRALIVLPEGEVPTIATVTDLSKLKDQPFFAKAKLGDKVIMYPKSKKAYLYDDANNKILEVAPISLGDEGAPTTVNTTETVTPATSKPKP